MCFVLNILQEDIILTSLSPSYITKLNIHKCSKKGDSLFIKQTKSNKVEFRFNIRVPPSGRRPLRLGLNLKGITTGTYRSRLVYILEVAFAYNNNDETSQTRRDTGIKNTCMSTLFSCFTRGNVKLTWYCLHNKCKKQVVLFMIFFFLLWRRSVI